MLTFTALVLIGITATAGYKGIPDSEDKAFVYERGEYSCVSQKTLPPNFTFVNTWPGYPDLSLYSEDAPSCPENFLFRLSTDRDDLKLIMSMTEDHKTYQFNETCNNDNSVTAWRDISGDAVFLITKNQKIKFICVYIKIDPTYNFQNVEYSVFTNNSCNFWLCLGHLEQFKRQPQYPPFTLAVDRANYYLAADSLPEELQAIDTGLAIDVLKASGQIGNYYLAADSLPEELQATDAGLAIDVLKASGQVFTIYKTPKRPIQTVEIRTPRLCSGMVVSMDFDGMCTISVELGANQVKYYVNGKSIIVETRPVEIIFTFTYATTYLYTFQPLGFYPLTDCKFDTTLVEKAEYNLKVWYDKTRTSSSCEMVKLRITDAVAIKRGATTMSTFTTTATGTAPTEAPATELSASTASTKVWAVVAVLCFASLMAIIVTVLLLICWLKKR
uniref:ORF14 n=1 Tax=Panagrellus redivivus TaxID=6233 RepID=A0A7E4UUE2_PANRE